ncbi:type II toxin-antitoxin system VapC family toxin [Streptomyces aidingensis]|uniref:Ribonuclease VapC n=1 Tax=Streptomyces aidingensis TaxID=910347 RepID=A0A1I1TE57_9ACTN|nr:type II toxin-antitoxin system VapC family toxin [Streptomyces aidingensis]SFD56856.1 hypothetical protein SAMN05421773_11956 [Streptomyces aidingensis]
MYLLDTNVVSEPRKRRPDVKVVEWYRGIPEGSLFVSALLIGELRKGVENKRSRQPDAAQALEKWLTRLKREFADRVLPVTPEVAERWGEMNAHRPFPVVDGLMAATALTHNLVLVTRNIKDFAGTGVRLLDPFEQG